MDVKSKDVNSIIPDLYYDLIARAIPGATFVLEAAFLSIPSTLFPESRIGDVSVGLVTASIFILLGVGYVVALLITPIGEHTRRLYTKRMWKTVLIEDSDARHALRHKLDITLTGSESIATLERSYRVLHDYVRSNDPSSRTLVLSKMQAEAALCTNLFSCSSLLLLGLACMKAFGVIMYKLPFSFLLGSPLHTAVAIAIPLLSGYAAYDRNKRNLERHLVFLRRLASRDQSIKAASAD